MISSSKSAIKRLKRQTREHIEKIYMTNNLFPVYIKCSNSRIRGKKNNSLKKIKIFDYTFYYRRHRDGMRKMLSIFSH